MPEHAAKAERLPIKLIMPRQGKESRVSGGGSPPTPFRHVDAAYRKSLSTQVSAIRSTITPQTEHRLVPVRVKLLMRAAAKSHRPQSVFSEETCPIVGAGKLGELFVKATPEGLTKLTKVIDSNKSEQITKELSCIEAIETVTPSYRRGGLGPDELLRRSPRGAHGFVTRVRLFNFGNSNDQAKIVSDFQETCHRHGIKTNNTGYSARSFNYSAECRSAKDVDLLSRIIGVRSVVGMPLIRTVRPMMYNAGPLPKLQKRSEVANDVPVVVVVDSGISDSIPDLNSWIIGRESHVAPEYRNTDHGTFVGGLICWGNQLNPHVANIDSNPCGLFDFQIIPNADPNKGDTDALKEQEFLISLDSALRQYANRYKVWNLSLSTDAVCSLDEFSSFAEELDNLQEKYEVSFVISAGNYATPPLLNYPRQGPQLEAGRITAPADSVLGITVGSVSHIDYKRDGPKEHHPSAFSRHGAGPNYIIKPDLVHYGGACSIDGSHVSGIRSLNGNGTAENLGTSFSAPLVSRTLAQIYHQITPTPKPVLARALLTHHARDPRTQTRVPDGEENFFGFGLPDPVPYCLECSLYTSTLVFDDVLRPGYYLDWDDFPYPDSLKKDGRYYGEIWMTVAFAPARGARWGSEYCETHIEAHFGVYQKAVSRKAGDVKYQFKGLVPPEHKNPGVLYESYQVERLRKWAPVRTYHGFLGERGQRGERWRLKLQLLTRHGLDADTLKSQPFALIITIADPQKKAPVYDEMARKVLTRFQAQNLAVRGTTQVRTQI